MHNDFGRNRNINTPAARTFVGRAAIGANTIKMNAFIGHFAWNPAVDDINDAADCRRSEQQCRWPAQHFDAIRRQRVDRNRMVDARVRYVKTADPVGKDTNALGLKPAQYRARRVGAKARRRHPSLAAERFTNRRADFAGKVIATNHRRSGEYVVAVARVNCGDNDVRCRLIMIAVILIGTLGSECWRSAYQKGGVQ